MYRGGHHQAQRGRYGRGGGFGGRGERGGQMGLENGQVGQLECGHDLGSLACGWRSHSEVAMKLHRADRHLVLPPGGEQELERIDPLLEEERREKARRARKGGAEEGAEEQQSSLITGLNISLSTPELIDQWIAERKKRWPSKAVVEKKIRESWDGRSDYKGKGRAGLLTVGATEHSKQPRPVQQRETDRGQQTQGNGQEKTGSASSSSSSSSSSDDDDEGDGSSGSDMDEEKDAISSKVPPPTHHSSEAATKPCRFFQQGRCNYGDRCRDRHEAPQTTTASQHPPVKKRKRPRMASPNPFEAPHLLRALLKNEIAQHINYIAQLVRFLVRNDYLADFEEREGEADMRARQRLLVVEQNPLDEQPSSTIARSEGSSELGRPIVDGGLPTLGNTLVEPTPAALKPLQSLALPPEPDPMAFMDPLRANDAKPLLHAQYRQIACDGGIRSVLLDEHGMVSSSMKRALSTLDALPSYTHRSSAIEQILGVSEQSQLHPHQVGPTFVRSDRNPSSSRVIGEAELFRCGLRVGPLEIGKIRQLASRVSDLVGGPAFEVDEEVDEMRPWWDKETREEMRQKKWSREADWRDEMRRLGLDVD